MQEKSLDAVMDDFQPRSKSNYQRLTRVISIPVPEEYKLKYETIQSRCAQQFIDKLREMIMLAIDRAETKTAP